MSPTPRAPLKSEKFYITTTPAGTTSTPQRLPNWYDNRLLHCKIAEQHEKPVEKLAAREKAKAYIEAPDVAMSVVIPAYNEEKRLVGMLEEAVAYLDKVYGRPAINTIEVEKEENSKPGKDNGSSASKPSPQNFNEDGTRRRTPPSSQSKSKSSTTPKPQGYEILLVNDGSSDATVEVALEFSHKHSLHDILRITTLAKNRGKGGAVCHGLRHVGGEYAVFADADGASRFGDLGKLVEGCKKVEDKTGRGVAVGSRAHLVGSEVVVKVCFIFSLPFIPHTSYCYCLSEESFHLTIPKAKVMLKKSILTQYRDLSSAILSCIPSISSCVFLPLPQHPGSAIRNADSSYSVAKPYHSSFHTCTPKAGFSMWRC